MLQAFLVVSVFALVYLAAAPTPVRRRLLQLAAAGGVLLVSAGWWVAAVALVPASSRPCIGGSQHDSVLEPALGYNGLGRLNAEETGGLGNPDQDAGWARMYGTDPAPTLAGFQSLVRQGRNHYFIGTGSGGGTVIRARSGSDAAQRIGEWVAANHTPATVGGTVLYDPGTG